MIDDPRADGRSWTGRARGWALVASVALNLFLVGWIAGGWTRQPPGPPPPFALAERLKARLSGEGVQRIGADLAALDAEAAGLGARFDAARRTVIAAAVAVPFDATALRAALGGLSAARASGEAAMTERLVTVIGRLDADDRRVFAETLFAPLPPPR